MEVNSSTSAKSLQSFRDKSKRGTRPTVVEIISEVVPDWAPHWKWLGGELKVKDSSIRILQHDNPKDCVNCCTSMLIEWLDCCPDATWGVLIDAIDKLLSYDDKDFQASTDLLRQHYKQKGFTPTYEEWPPYYSDHYTPLTIIHHERQCTETEISSIAKEFLVKGSRSQEKRSISINELFFPFEGPGHPFLLLIEGAPGTGKTHLSKEIAMQWATHNILPNTTLLFLLRISDPQVKNISGISSLVNHFCEDSTQAEKITKWLEKNHGKNFTILLDGFDEVSDNNKSDFINDIINRDRLTNCGIVILSRPTVSSNLHHLVDCRAEILGFTEENRQTFIQNVLKNENDKKELESFLQKHPFLNSLCYIPLYINILLCLTKDGTTELPNNQTELFEKFVITTIIHFLKKKDKSFSSVAISSFDDLPSPYKENTMTLSKFAFLALQKEQIVFTYSEIKALCPDLNPSEWLKLGLLKTAQYFKHGSDQESFHFLHPVIQEFMAVYYIASPSLKYQELQCLLRETFFNVHYFNTWIMYVGITKGNNLEFKHFLSGRRLKIYSQMSQSSTISNKILNDKIKCLYLLHCVGEADELLSCIENIFPEEVIDLSHQSLSLTNIRTLAILLSKSHNKRWEKLDLSHCNIDDKACKIFFEAFEAQSTMVKIKCVDISSNNIYWESFTKLCKFFSLWNTEELILSIDIVFNSKQVCRINKFFDIVTKAIKVESPLPVYGKLLFNYSEETNWMIAVYVDDCYIKCAKFSNCKLGSPLVDKLKSFASDIGITAATHIDKSIYSSKNFITSKLAKILPTNVQNVRFCGSNLHSKGAYLLNFDSAATYPNLPWCEQVADYLAAVLCYNSTHSNKSYLSTFPDMLADKVKQLVQNVSSTRTVDVVNNGIGDEAIDDIMVILFHCNKLINVHFAGNSLQKAGAKKIAETLSNITNLTILNLENNIICEEAASYIADVLSHNTRLQQLYLGGNNLKGAGIIKIAIALQRTTSLSTFSIENNNVGDELEAADKIAAVLYKSHKLQRLYLGGNNLYASSAITIVSTLRNPEVMTTFGMQNNYIGDEAANSFAYFLSRCTKLECLFIGGSQFESIGFTKIMGGLGNITTLKVFDMQNNTVTSEEDIDAIAVVISRNKGLAELYLGGVNLQSNGAIRIATALEHTTTLIKLGLQSNSISYTAANDIANVLSHNQDLQELHLGDNELMSEGAIVIAKPLQSISTLIKYNIESNQIDDEAVDHIVAIAYYNEKLQDVLIGGNKLGVEGSVKIARALEHLTEI